MPADTPMVQTIEQRFPALNDHLIRMASTGNTGSLAEWGDFFNCLREALLSGEDPHEMFEAFVAEAIAKSPEPLQELGRFLADRLDEDDWKTADRLLLQLATRPTPATPEGLREKVAMTYEDAEKLALKAIHDDGRGMIGRNRNHLHQRVARAILSAHKSALQPQAQGGE